VQSADLGEVMKMKFRRREKVAIYITREKPNGWELLVFHPQSAPESDWQIPAGTIEDAEIAKEAAVRETLEESGLSLASVQYVGEEEMRYPERMRVHYTYFYHAHIECQENRWTHCVAGDGQDCGDFFDFAWLPRTDYATRTPPSYFLRSFDSSIGTDTSV